MTHDDIIRLALESGGHQGDECEQCGETHLLWIFGTEELECFAALVAAAEREACAKVCEELNAWNEDDPGSSAAAAIRARGQE